MARKPLIAQTGWQRSSSWNSKNCLRTWRNVRIQTSWRILYVRIICDFHLVTTNLSVCELFPNEIFLLIIEFQKRGFPHCRILISIDKRDAKVEAEFMDKVGSCEVPDSLTQPGLYAAVKKFTIHGPVGTTTLARLACRRQDRAEPTFPSSFVAIPIQTRTDTQNIGNERAAAPWPSVAT